MTPTNWDPETFTRALDHIKHHGYTNTDLANMARVSLPQVSRWSSGKHRPNHQAIQNLSQAIREDAPAPSCLSALATLCTAAGYPGVAAHLNLGASTSLPQEKNNNPYEGQVWRLVRRLQGRARVAGLNPDEEEEVIKQALASASDQAELALDAAMFRRQRG